MKLIIGLGNPGERYSKTRHNVGFMVIDRIAEKLGADFTLDNKTNAKIATHSIGSGQVWLIKPQTYMNLSGNSVGNLANYYKVAPHELVVIHDDLDLSLGAIRVRTSGSAGGHRGSQSIMDAVGADFTRVRLGIGRGESEPKDFVLSDFTSEEQETLQKVLDAATDLIVESEFRVLENQSINVAATR